MMDRPHLNKVLPQDPKKRVSIVSAFYTYSMYNLKSLPLGVPTLPKFISFPMTTGSKVNLAEKIGAEYDAFGILLLNDDSGDATEAIIQQYQKDAKKINVQIFRLWLKGNGRQPVSWDTLVCVLMDMGREKLASNITDTFKS